MERAGIGSKNRWRVSALSFSHTLLHSPFLTTSSPPPLPPPPPPFPSSSAAGKRDKHTHRQTHRQRDGRAELKERKNWKFIQILPIERQKIPPKNYKKKIIKE